MNISQDTNKKIAWVLPLDSKEIKYEKYPKGSITIEEHARQLRKHRKHQNGRK